MPTRHAAAAGCLWEIMCAVESRDCQLVVRLPSAEEEAFRREINSNFRGAMQALVKTQAERAETWNPADRAMIFEAIEGTCGFHVLNGVGARVGRAAVGLPLSRPLPEVLPLVCDCALGLRLRPLLAAASLASRRR